MLNRDVVKQVGLTSIEGARELVELTDHIVANQRDIDESDSDLDGLVQQTSNVLKLKCV